MKSIKYFSSLLLFALITVSASSQKDSSYIIPELKTANRPVDSNLLVVINGKNAGTLRELKKDLNNLVPADLIERVNVVKGSDALNKYGSAGKSGVIEIFLKENLKIITADNSKNEVPPPPPPVSGINQTDGFDRTFEKVEIEAAFPGGDATWRKYLEKTLNPEVAINSFAPPGKYTVLVQFIVGKEGVISDVKALTNHGFGMEQEVIRVITKGPNWTPAIMNGKPVKAYRKQPVTFVVIAEDFKLSTYTLSAGVENTITLDGLGIKPEDLDITMPGAAVKPGENGIYQITPSTPGRVLLTVWITKKGKKQELGKVSMLVK